MFAKQGLNTVPLADWQRDGRWPYGEGIKRLARIIGLIRSASLWSGATEVAQSCGLLARRTALQKAQEPPAWGEQVPKRVLVKHVEKCRECIAQYRLETATRFDWAVRWLGCKALGNFHVRFEIAYDLPEVNLFGGTRKTQPAMLAANALGVAKAAELMDDFSQMLVRDAIAARDLVNRDETIRPQAKQHQDSDGILGELCQAHMGRTNAPICPKHHNLATNLTRELGYATSTGAQMH